VISAQMSVQVVPAEAAPGSLFCWTCPSVEVSIAVPDWFVTVTVRAAPPPPLLSAAQRMMRTLPTVSPVSDLGDSHAASAALY
jgi:hypothetical protein